ncbi:MAG: response regulator [Nitrospirae bacterium]|nr:response regulator [Nitrospirota bacterium]MBI5694623.1 response regulator [Nitrospirota bacterium]
MKTRELLRKAGLVGSIRGRLALYFMLLAIVPFVIIGAIAYNSEKDVLRDRIRGHLTSIADSQKTRIRAWLDERASEARFLARDTHVMRNLEGFKITGDPLKYVGTDNYVEILDELNSLKANHEYLDVLILDERGKVMVSTIEKELGESRAGEGYFKGGASTGFGGCFIQDIYQDTHLGDIAMAFASPILESPGSKKLGGVVVIIIGMEKSFYPSFEEWPGMGSTGDVLIARQEAGEIVFLNRLKFHKEAPLNFRVKVDDDAPKPILYGTSGKEGIIETADYRGVQVLAAYRYIPEMKWGLVVKEDHDDAFAPVHDLSRKVLVLMVVAVVIVFLLIHVVTARITEPIVTLDRLTDRVAQGDFSVNLPVTRDDEIGRLASSFNDMAGSLMNYKVEVDEKSAELEKANRELATLAESLEEKVRVRTQELEELNRALISMMEDLDERTVELEKSQVELKKFAADLEESRNRVRDNLEIVERANVELRRIDRMKDQFLGMMSHELRTPLSLITGYSSNLLADRNVRLDPSVEEGLEGIYKGAERLKSIVTEMLDISQIDARGLRLSSSPMDLGELLDEVLKELSSFVRERGHVIEVGDFSGIPKVYIDRRRLHQVLLNIVGNAIKFTPDGGKIYITPTFHVKGSEFARRFGRSETDYLDLVIKDGGIGVDREEAERIFEKFYEVGEIDKHATSKYRFLGRGVGLGLPIARGIMEAHGGRLWVESEGYDPLRCPGSAFHVLLPVGREYVAGSIPSGLLKDESEDVTDFRAEPLGQAAADVHPFPEKSAADMKGRPKVLVVEDDEDIMNLTSLLLARDYKVYRATNGSDGLEKAREVTPDLILLDVYMEGMNGYEVCEELKSDERTKFIPVAMFTAGVQRWEVDKGYKSGADDYITKPFKPEELLSKVRDMISGVFEASGNSND